MRHLRRSGRPFHRSPPRGHRVARARKLALVLFRSAERVIALKANLRLLGGEGFFCKGQQLGGIVATRAVQLVTLRKARLNAVLRWIGEQRNGGLQWLLLPQSKIPDRGQGDEKNHQKRPYPWEGPARSLRRFRPLIGISAVFCLLFLVFLRWRFRARHEPAARSDRRFSRDRYCRHRPGSVPG